jgi:hypothetical protein
VRQVAAGVLGFSLRSGRDHFEQADRDVQREASRPNIVAHFWHDVDGP